jgi:indole-3-glycerol phosphate synthase
MNILDKIVANKREEVAKAKAQRSVYELSKSNLFERSTLSLAKNLTDSLYPGVIAEFKRQSPSKGVINATVQPEIVTAGYSTAGAVALSVLTDELFFGGNFVDFAKAREANPRTPMLRKDFMIDEYQLYEAKSIGADIVLLIAACLSAKEVSSMAKKARELGLEVLLEVHDAQELKETLCDEVTMVGVNNRNLKTFVTSIDTSLELAELIPDNFIKISESGLKDAKTIGQLFAAGYEGFLIGETFMKTADPAQKLTQLQLELNQFVKHKPLVL